MMRTTSRLAAVLIAVILLVGVVGPAHVYAGGPVSPRAMLQVYYNTINNRQYSVAYQQWTQPPYSYAQFVAGYATTTYVESYFGGFQPGYVGGVQGGVPSVLIGYHTDGSAVAYSGCYFLTYNGASGVGQWLITGANMQPLSYIPNPSTNQIDSLLLTECYASSNPAYYDTVQQLLVDYYNAVNRGDYQMAYSYWVNPPQTYQQFVAGWGDTLEVVMFYGAYQFGGYYNVAETGRVPVVLLGYHTDGSMVAYQGCIRVSYSTAYLHNRAIAGANLVTMPYAAIPPSAAITQALQASCY